LKSGLFAEWFGTSRDERGSLNGDGDRRGPDPGLALSTERDGEGREKKMRRVVALSQRRVPDAGRRLTPPLRTPARRFGRPAPHP